MSKECSPLLLNESASFIENQSNCINSPTSNKSIASYLKLLACNNPQVFPDNKPDHKSKPKQLNNNVVCRNALSKGVFLNPHISSSIKIKINELIADSNIAQSSYGRYHFYTNKSQTHPSSLIKTYTKLNMLANSKYSFSNVSITKDSSASKITQMKHKIEKGFDPSSFNQPLIIYSSRNNNRIKPFQPLKHTTFRNISHIKKKMFNENEDEINTFQKEFQTFKKIAPHKVNENNFFLRRIIN